VDKTYYETIDKMEKNGIDSEYLNGWASGYLRNPKREEQSLNDAYNAGYEDGMNKNTDHMKDWGGK
jgi:hypothetical protein